MAFVPGLKALSLLCRDMNPGSDVFTGGQKWARTTNSPANALPERCACAFDALCVFLLVILPVVLSLCFLSLFFFSSSRHKNRERERERERERASFAAICGSVFFLSSFFVEVSES